MQHPAAVRALPPVRLGINRPVAGQTRGCPVRRREERHGALGVRARGEIAHAARREHRRKGECLARNVGKLGGREAEASLARQQTGGPHDARQRLVVEQPGQQVREQRLEPDLAAADRLDQRPGGLGGAVLDVGDHLQRALCGPAVVGVTGEAGERRVEVLAVDLEAALLQVGVPDVGVDRGQPVERPALGRHEPDAAARDPRLPHLHVDLELGGLGERHPHLAQEDRAGREEPGAANERAAPVRHARPARGRVEPGYGDAHEVAVPLRLLVQGRGRRNDGGRRSTAPYRRSGGERGGVPPEDRQRA